MRYNFLKALSGVEVYLNGAAPCFGRASPLTLWQVTILISVVLFPRGGDDCQFKCHVKTFSMASCGVSSNLSCTVIAFLDFKLPSSDYLQAAVEVHVWWILISPRPQFEPQILQGWSPEVVAASTQHLALSWLRRPVLAPDLLMWLNDHFWVTLCSVVIVTNAVNWVLYPTRIQMWKP